MSGHDTRALDRLRHGVHRCSEHTDEAVTWKGTGCRECAQREADRADRKRQEQAAVLRARQRRTWRGWTQ